MDLADSISCWFADGRKLPATAHKLLPEHNLAVLKVDADNLVASLTLPQGTTVEEARKAVDQLEASLEQVRAEFDGERQDGMSVILHVQTSIGSQPRSAGVGPGAGTSAVPAAPASWGQPGSG